jgi:hypothetical protein
MVFCLCVGPTPSLEECPLTLRLLNSRNTASLRWWHTLTGRRLPTSPKGWTDRSLLVYTVCIVFLPMYRTAPFPEKSPLTLCQLNRCCEPSVSGWYVFIGPSFLAHTRSSSSLETPHIQGTPIMTCPSGCSDMSVRNSLIEHVTIFKRIRDNYFADARLPGAPLEKGWSLHTDKKPLIQDTAIMTCASGS